jgi:hypothetical protein
MKLVWIYLCDNCDHAGIWDINLKLMAFQIGEATTLDELVEGLGDKVKVLSNNKLFLPSFVDFQYGDLNPDNRVHKSVLDRLEKEGAYKDHVRPLQRAKDKDKEKEKDKDKDSGGSAEGGVQALSQPTETPVGVYVTAYAEKYGHRPPVGRREGNVLKNFAANHPERWPELIRGYLQMPDSWAVARSHPVEVLVTKVNEITRFLETGKVVTRKVIQNAEELIDKAQGTDKRPRRSLDEIEAERKAMLDEAANVHRIGGAK